MKTLHNYKVIFADKRKKDIILIAQTKEDAIEMALEMFGAGFAVEKICKCKHKTIEKLFDCRDCERYFRETAECKTANSYRYKGTAKSLKIILK